MPLARASCSTATPASRGIRSYVRHDPSAKADTSRPDASERPVGKRAHGARFYQAHIATSAA